MVIPDVVESTFASGSYDSFRRRLGIARDLFAVEEVVCGVDEQDGADQGFDEGLVREVLPAPDGTAAVYSHCFVVVASVERVGGGDAPICG